MRVEIDHLKGCSDPDLCDCLRWDEGTGQWLDPGGNPPVWLP